MDYNHIGNFFSKFKQVLFKSEEANGAIAVTISKHISIPIETKSLKVKGTIIYIQGSPILRNEILIHKNGILKDLSDILIDRKFTDIR